VNRFSFRVLGLFGLGLLFGGVLATAPASSNFSLSLSRRMVNHFTNFLAADTPGLNSLIFDLTPQGLEMKILLDKAQIPFLKYVTPTYRPGEIFKEIEDRQSGVLVEDENDFQVGFELLFTLKTDSKDPDSCIFFFKNPKVLAYYRQDLKKYISLLTELGELQSRARSLREQLRIQPENQSQISRVRLLKKRTTLMSGLGKVTRKIRQNNELVNRFSSGAYLALLPSDEALTELVSALGGQLKGDKILTQVFKRVAEMGVLNSQLKIELLGEIQARSGRVRVSNLGKALGGFIPGLKITEIRIDNPTIDPGKIKNQTGLEPHKLPLVIEGVVKPEKESQ
jgi:hypothetical protein